MTRAATFRLHRAVTLNTARDNHLRVSTTDVI